MSQRLFTLSEANALIPKLELVMGKLQSQSAVLREQMNQLVRTLGETPERLSVPQILELRPQLRPVVDEVEKLLAEIAACGGQMKGLDLGLVDFPAEMNGDIVLLCWQYGEKEIGYYHSFEAGFAGRQPLEGSKRDNVLQ